MQLPDFWSAAREVAREMPVILAGGLDADNVIEALETVTPAAVDVARGVEAAPGHKDPTRLRALFAAVGTYHALQAPA